MQKRINPLEVKQEAEKVEKAPKEVKVAKPEVKPVVKPAAKKVEVVKEEKVAPAPVAEQKKFLDIFKDSTIFVGFLNKEAVANAKAKNPGKKLAEIINEALAEKGK